MNAAGSILSLAVPAIFIGISVALISAVGPEITWLGAVFIAIALFAASVGATLLYSVIAERRAQAAGEITALTELRIAITEHMDFKHSQMLDRYRSDLDREAE